MENIVDRITSTAKEKGISLTFLCKKMGLSSRTYFTDIKKSGREIPDDKLNIIAKALGVSVEYLLGKTDEKDSPNGSGEPVPRTAKQKELFDRIDQMSEDEIDDMMEIIKIVVKKREK